MLISIHELTLTCKNSKKIALNSREVGVLDQSSLWWYMVVAIILLFITMVQMVQGTKCG